ncbi:hypothetical protein PoB_004087900 [Plakobranchus ocellatus]|uniref:Secreted protein n=1 Tax=Plakobranchus ocellatus TaxID=259542 RepID=A0AAV4B2U6_9GAST|nr:hypothetical protein PoB_004087900 [Plakobranchus ocellatus]
MSKPLTVVVVVVLVAMLSINTSEQATYSPYSPYMFQAEFALNCATHFCDIALVVFEPRSLRPRTRQVTVHAPPVLVSTFDPSTRGGRVQAQSRLRSQSD